MPDGNAARQVDRGIRKEFDMMMGFGFLMMLLVIGVPLAGIVVLVVWLVSQARK